MKNHGSRSIGIGDSEVEEEAPLSNFDGGRLRKNA